MKRALHAIILDPKVTGPDELCDPTLEDLRPYLLERPELMAELLSSLPSDALFSAVIDSEDDSLIPDILTETNTETLMAELMVRMEEKSRIPDPAATPSPAVQRAMATFHAKLAELKAGGAS